MTFDTEYFSSDDYHSNPPLPDEPVSDDIGCAPCNQAEMGAFVELKNEDNIRKFHDNTLSPLPNILAEDYDDEAYKQVPLQYGIPLSNINSIVSQYAQMPFDSNNNSPLNGLICIAQEIKAMNDFADALQSELGAEEYLKLCMLMDKSVTNTTRNPAKATDETAPRELRIVIKYKGKTIHAEDAKLSMNYFTDGGYFNASDLDYAEHKKPGDAIPHIRVTGDNFFTDSFKVFVYPHITLYNANKINLYDPYSSQPYDYSEAFSGLQSLRGVEHLSENWIPLSDSYKSAQELAKEFLDTVLDKVEQNSLDDALRDTVLEVADMTVTVAAIATGTIGFKMAGKAAYKAARAGLIALEANHLATTYNSLEGRWIGISADEAYDPLKSYAQILDKKIGGHGLEAAYHALNTLVTFGRSPKMIIATGITSTATGAYLGVGAQWLNEIRSEDVQPGGLIQFENLERGEP